MTTYALNGLLFFDEKDGRQKFKIHYFNKCEIKSSWKDLTDTAEIELPRNVPDFDNEKVTEWFRVGDPITVTLGYDFNVYKEFTGYIAKVTPGIPIKLYCQDEMFQLKQKRINVSLNNPTLKEFIQAVAPDYDVVCDETKLLGSVRFSNYTPAQCLEAIKEKGITCFFVDKTLYAMDSINRLYGDVHNIIIEETATESQQLSVKNIENIKVIIELIRLKGKKIRVEHGDETAGTIITRSYSGLELTESEMTEIATKIYDRAKTPGLDGDIRLFGVPRVKVGDKLIIGSYMYINTPEYKCVEKGKKYAYEIDSLTKIFFPTEPSYRQICTLGDRVIIE